MSRAPIPHHLQTYRPDIDGLRAIAVAAVVIFHAFPGSLPGGFIGVDIFFVISGYLITGILIDRIDQHRFSLWHFYKQRAKRIFPALSLVMASTFLMGWRLLLPEEFKQLGAHMAASAFFVQNFVLFHEIGYFDVASELKPLMHLWSLAIEEQFYLLYPPALWLMWRLRVPRLGALLIMAGASLLANLYLVHQNPSAAFFMPYTRFWELLAGGVLASVMTGSQRHADLIDFFHRRADAASVVGMALLLAGLAITTRDVAFPGWYALLPVLGTVLLIASGRHARLAEVVLANRLAVSIGLISYPLYLWHWPLLAYLNILEDGAATPADRLIVIAASIGLAWLTYRVLERPLRFSQDGWMKMPGLLACLGLIAYLGLNTYQREGLPFRLRHAAQIPKNDLIDRIDFMDTRCGLPPNVDPGLYGMCLQDRRARPRFAVIGDSKAKSLAPGLLESSTPASAWMAMGGPTRQLAFVPVISDAPIYQKYQSQVAHALKALLGTPTLEVVVITTSTRSLFLLKGEDTIDDLPASLNGPAAQQGLGAFVDQLVAGGKKVVLTVDNPTLKDPKRCLFSRKTGIRALDEHFSHQGDRHNCEISYDRQRELAKPYLDVLEAIRARHPHHVRLFDPTSMLCDMTRRVCGLSLEGQLMYSYTDHVSDHASRVIARSLVPFVIAFSQDTGPTQP